MHSTPASSTLPLQLCGTLSLHIMLHTGVLVFMCLCGVRDLQRADLVRSLTSVGSSSALPVDGDSVPRAAAANGSASPARFITYGSIVVPNPAAERLETALQLATDPVHTGSDDGSSSSSSDEDGEDTADDASAEPSTPELFSPTGRREAFVPPPFNLPPYVPTAGVKVGRCCLSLPAALAC